MTRAEYQKRWKEKHPELVKKSYDKYNKTEKARACAARYRKTEKAKLTKNKREILNSKRYADYICSILTPLDY